MNTNFGRMTSEANSQRRNKAEMWAKTDTFSKHFVCKNEVLAGRTAADPDVILLLQMNGYG